MNWQFTPRSVWGRRCYLHPAAGHAARRLRDPPRTHGHPQHALPDHECQIWRSRIAVTIVQIASPTGIARRPADASPADPADSAARHVRRAGARQRQRGQRAVAHVVAGAGIASAATAAANHLDVEQRRLGSAFGSASVSASSRGSPGDLDGSLRAGSALDFGSNLIGAAFGAWVTDRYILRQPVVSHDALGHRAIGVALQMPLQLASIRRRSARPAPFVTHGRGAATATRPLSPAPGRCPTGCRRCAEPDRHAHHVGVRRRRRVAARRRAGDASSTPGG